MTPVRRPERVFRAVLEPGVPDTLKLYCRRCETWEEGIDLRRVQDHAELHAQWFHKGFAFASVLKKVNW